MKQFLILALISVIQAPLATAKPVDPSPQCGRIKTLAIKMCGTLEFTDMTEKTDAEFGPEYENLILHHLKITTSTKDYFKRMANFWNTCSQHLICTSKNDPRVRKPQHFMKRALDLDLCGSVFTHFLLKGERSLAYTFNQVEMHNGKEETIIDYIDNILVENDDYKYTITEVKRLRRKLTKLYGAKNAANLRK